jgi:hypothetical protein
MGLLTAGLVKIEPAAYEAVRLIWRQHPPAGAITTAPLVYVAEVLRPIPLAVADCVHRKHRSSHVLCQAYTTERAGAKGRDKDILLEAFL